MKLRAEQGASEGLWLRAEKQTGGKGRLGRKWESPEGNLFCSSVVRIGEGDPPSSSLSFVAALGVYDAIRACLPGGDLVLKWPNDILLNGCKVCGILLERTADAIIVGIGVNIAVAPDVEGRTVTSLHQAGVNKALTAADFLELLTGTFAKRLDDWRTLGLQSTFGEWEKLAHAIGASLSVSVSKDDRIDGEFAGLTEEGALRLRKPDGTLIEIHAGDVVVG